MQDLHVIVIYLLKDFFLGMDGLWSIHLLCLLSQTAVPDTTVPYLPALFILDADDGKRPF